MSKTLLKFGRRAIKSSAAPLLRLTGRLKRRIEMRRQATGRVMILCYHRVVPDIVAAEREAIYGLLVSTESFRRHLEVVREQYEVLTLDEAVSVIRGEKQTARPAAVITFDDGYRDNYDHALPVLREMGLPATIFVSTGLIGSGVPLHHDRICWQITRAFQLGYELRRAFEGVGLRAIRVDELCRKRDPLAVIEQIVHLPFAVRERLLEKLEAALGADYPPGFELLDWKMIAEMEQAGVSFGSHSDQHPVLTLEDPHTIERELRRSKRTLEDRLGHPASQFAYPNGSYNEAIKGLVARLGFSVAVTTERRLAQQGDDLHALARVSLCEESTRGVLGRYSRAVAQMRLFA
ncbi:MAG TPA: polysaccharide deacetylase family protein [Blastocatellia bacterium]|nr:polysaccharide deacetylase family protein [Blastocatellia bacterium]